jgi:predicted KAP-like P-loop ATPase
LAFKATTGLYLPVMKTSLEDSKQERQRDPEAFAVDAEDLQELREICVAKIREAATSGALKSHPKMVYLLYRWGEWTSPEEPREWVGKLVESEEGLLALLTAFLQQSTSHGVGDYVARVYWYISLKSLEDFIPADLLAEKTQQLQLEKLDDKERKAIHAFQRALKRREEGRSDDDWLHDNDNF